MFCFIRVNKLLNLRAMYITRVWIMQCNLFVLFSFNFHFSAQRHGMTFSREYLLSLQRYAGRLNLRLSTHCFSASLKLHVTINQKAKGKEMVFKSGHEARLQRWARDSLHR